MEKRQVLAGSIVEAVLVDYLIAASAVPSGMDPLELDLGKAVTMCKQAGALSQRTVDLCSVIRSYRNLIHPGRAIRLSEEPPNESSAGIARSLINLIIGEISKVRRDTFGLTAEQLLSKIERDANCLPILHKLLEEMPSAERDRLYTDLLPKRYIAVARGEAGSFGQEDLDHLGRAYEIVRQSASADARRRAVFEYLGVLRQGDGALVGVYDDALFRLDEIHYLPTEQRALIKEHHLAKAKRSGTMRALRALRGIEPFLEATDAYLWVDAFVQVITSPNMSDDAKKQARDQFIGAQFVTSVAIDAAIEKRLERWQESFSSNGRADAGASVAQLKAAILEYRQYEDFPATLD